MSAPIVHLGDCSTVLATLKPNSVDLAYADPPFCSQRVYGPEGHTPDFSDVWAWDEAARDRFLALALGWGLTDTYSRIVNTFRCVAALHGEGPLLSYLTAMALHIVHIHRVLRPGRAFYLHCDPTAGPYLRLLLDAVFGPAQFRNEVVWRYRRWPSPAKHFQRMHDTLLVYEKSRDPGDATSAPVFHTLYGYEDLAPSTKKSFKGLKQRAVFDADRKRTTKRMLDEPSAGPPLSDVWEISVVAPSGKERRGYPTQKPEALLERVIRASSNEGDVVLDPFCGSGTTLAVAIRLGRRAIGIDQNPRAVDLATGRLLAQELLATAR